MYMYIYMCICIIMLIIFIALPGSKYIRPQSAYRFADMDCNLQIHNLHA